MAHFCFDCSTACRCHGDTDDTVLGTLATCTHCYDDDRDLDDGTDWWEPEDE